MLFIMKPTYRRQAGYSVLELVIVLSVLTLLTIQFVPLQDEYTETAAENYTTRGLYELANGAKAFYVESGSSAWPADLSTLLDAGFIPGYSSTSSRRFNNGFGNEYQLASVGDSLEITTSVADSSNAQAIASSWGPLARYEVATNQVTVTVLRPGYEISHDALLTRDGSRPMIGDLDMQDSNVLNGDAVYSQSIETNRVFARDDGTGLVQTDTMETTLISAETFEYKN